MREEIYNSFKNILSEAKDKKKKSSSVIDMNKLEDYAKGIALLDIDYGITYVNEEENKICISLGDGNPFDMKMLEDQIPYAVGKNGYKDADIIDLEIDCEFQPNTSEGGWKKWDKYGKGGWKNC